MRVRNETGSTLVLPTLDPPRSVADGEEFDLDVPSDDAGPILPMGVVAAAKTTQEQVERAERRRERDGEAAAIAARGGEQR